MGTTTDKEGTMGTEVARLHPGQRQRGLEGISDRRILGQLYPSLRIVHSIRTDQDQASGKKIGGYVLGDTPLAPPVEVVFLKAHKIRLLKEDPSGEGNREKMVGVCASSNGDVPLEHLHHPRNSTCFDCEYGQWKDGPAKKRIPPKCKEGIAFLGLIPSLQDSPFWFVCSGSGSKGHEGSYKRAIGLIQAFRRMTQVSSLAQLVVSLSTTMEKNEGVVWYDPVFTITQTLLPAAQYLPLVEAAIDVAWFEPFVREGATDPGDDAIEVEGNGGAKPLETSEKDPWDTGTSDL